jgi:hypothetical protein
LTASSFFLTPAFFQDERAFSLFFLKEKWQSPQKLSTLSGLNQKTKFQFLFIDLEQKFF